MGVLGTYKNGNYSVVMLNDGTKIRYNNLDSFNPERPESIDLKITNRCNMGCPACHEDSHKGGKHGDIMNLKFIDTMLPYSEVAIGGGNVLTHPDLVAFLKKLKERKIIANATFNQNHFMDNIDFIRKLVDDKLIYGVGVSLMHVTEEFIDAISSFDNAVVHVINGIVGVNELEKMSNCGIKVLILGYKEFRRGKDMYSSNSIIIEKTKSELYDALQAIVEEEWFDCVSFDNLAIKQLDPKRIMSEEQWEQFYLGDDGSFTMYVDAVEGKFTKSSTSTERFDMMDDIKDMFDIVRGKWAV